MKKGRPGLFFGIIAIILLVSLIIKLRTVPGGMILPGLILGLMFISIILLACLIVSFLLKLVLKRYSFSTLYFLSVTVGLLFYHYHLYSPTLRIIVPDNYIGEVTLVLSNLDENILLLDSAGIGYLTNWTFKKTYTQPDVFTVSGKRLNDQCVGFNPSTFWGSGRFCCLLGKTIRTLSFEIVPLDKRNHKQYYSADLAGHVDPKKIY